METKNKYVYVGTDKLPLFKYGGGAVKKKKICEWVSMIFHSTPLRISNEIALLKFIFSNISVLRLWPKTLRLVLA